MRIYLARTLDETIRRGYTDNTTGLENRVAAERKMDILDDIVLMITTYGSKSIYVVITERSTSYKKIFESMR